MPRPQNPISEIRLSIVQVPIATPVSDAKVATGRQTALSRCTLLVAEVLAADGSTGIGFSYALRTGGRALYAHAQEVAELLIGREADDIELLFDEAVWAGASVGRSGVSVQAIAAIDTALWDLRARRLDVPLARLIGQRRPSVPVYNTSRGYLNASIDEMLDGADGSLAAGIGGIKIKVGQPDWRKDLRRVEAVRRHIGDTPLMVDANQQWTRTRAAQMANTLEPYDLTWIEEPLDAYDTEGYTALTASTRTPISTGEMLSSVHEHRALLRAQACDVLQPDAPRVGGITPFIRILHLAHDAGIDLAPHFVMEIHVHLAACFPGDVWVEHFNWLEPVFEERLERADGRLLVPERPGLGFTISEQARAWTTDTVTVRAS